jgi:hypothetical protein
MLGDPETMVAETVARLRKRRGLPDALAGGQPEETTDWSRTDRRTRYPRPVRP